MTNPGQGGQWPPRGQYPQGQGPNPQYHQQTGPGYGQGQYGRPGPQGQYDQHQYGQNQGQYQQGQYQQGNYAQGQYQQNQYAQGQYAQGEAGPQFDQPGAGYPVPESGRKKPNRGLVIGLVIALVVAIGGGLTWFALSQSDSVAAGAATPTEAVQNLASSLSTGDAVGLLGGLSPAEAKLFTDPVDEATKELKRLGVLDANADPKALGGFSIKTENLQFDEAGAERVNDHLTIAKLVGGTITTTVDPAKFPIAKEFLDSMGGRGTRAQQGPQTETTDIADVVRREGKPVRIATVQVDGEWYPSMLYTIADYALADAKQSWPSTSIPANGAASAQDAVRELAQAALDGNITRAIELTPPDEMGALHDAGPAIVAAAQADDTKPTGAKINKLEVSTADVEGGTRATLTALDVTTPAGQQFSVTKNGDCYQVNAEGQAQTFCAKDLPALLARQSGSSRNALPADVQDALQHLGSGIFAQGIGVITTEVDGKHYVSPIRTFVEQGMTVLRALQPGDLKALMRLSR